MPIARLTLVCLLGLMLTLVVQAMADQKVTAGDVTFEVQITGSDKDGFDILATNSGKTDRSCQASLTLTKKDGTKQTWKYRHSVRGDYSANQSFYSEAGISGAPLSDPELTAGCE
jgi:hypothetical protein